MGIVSTIPEKCRRCYTCVRECPAKAIKVISGQATVIAEQCIACGNCVKVCTQKAKRIEDSSMAVAQDAGRGRAGVRLSRPFLPRGVRGNGAGQDRFRRSRAGRLPGVGSGIRRGADQPGVRHPGAAGHQGGPARGEHARAPPSCRTCKSTCPLFTAPWPPSFLP